MVLQGIVWIRPPFGKGGGEGRFKRKDATLLKEERKIGRGMDNGYMKDIGLRVLRFSDREVLKNTQGVLERIWGYL